ncbi:glycerol-3-phosphate acyltransferase [Fervidobacterium gondwanense]|uniref:Glycerol-3-phosphate acyltransferase n=1 Tax=Fervidobacterium gondwanense DSM 13020 TaxID=1121883 RepID=A0A1M7SJM6_FERGO|nr:glycerol-3-phosphate acyltransferase [Fervidobacterium gondwanense]SHN58691.1 acyl-phosphate glycerol 3-phosphate acyltransferase [Fervidobacterium gondwanense DSM 13020]
MTFYWFALIVLQFISGSIMYSHIFAKILGIDLRKVRDGNPGSTNLWRAAGWKWGFLALALDYFKGVLPLAIFAWNTELKISPYIVSLAALAGIAGHAFSPLLRFNGGKAIATTFGAWSVLTRWEGPTVLGITFTLFSIANKLMKRKGTTPETDALRVFVGFFFLLLYTLWKSLNGSPELILLYVGNLLIIAYKHRREITKLVKGRCKA